MRPFRRSADAPHDTAADGTVRRLAAESAIRGVLAKYASAVDRLDYSEVRECYRPAAIDDHGTYSGDVEGLLQHLPQLLDRHLVTTHFLGNVRIELVTESLAVSETYAQLACRYAGQAGEADLFVGIRYVDRWSGGKDPFDWLITHRQVVYDWSRIDAVTRRWEQAEGFATRARDPSDPWVVTLELVRREAFGDSRAARQDATER